MLFKSVLFTAALLTAIPLQAQSPVDPDITVYNPLTDVTTAEIIAETKIAAPACAKWFYPAGMCTFLTCTPVGCYTSTSLITAHYNPDLVVTAYHGTGHSPWYEMRLAFGALQKGAAQALLSGYLGVIGQAAGLLIGEGDQTEGRTEERGSHRTLTFKEADAIGHPLQTLNLVLDVDVLCPSESVPFTPYFLSGEDVIEWRFSLVESFFPESWLPGLREVGTFPLNTWGPLFPRGGFVFAPEEPKGGAVIAQRAGDIVTRIGQPHLYVPTAATRREGGMQIIGPPPLVENNHYTGIWQMHRPTPLPICGVFGKTDTLLPPGLGWADLKGDPFRNYTFTLWRPYECCRRVGQTLIAVIPWVDWQDIGPLW